MADLPKSETRIASSPNRLAVTRAPLRFMIATNAIMLVPWARMSLQQRSWRDVYIQNQY